MQKNSVNNKNKSTQKEQESKYNEARQQSFCREQQMIRKKQRKMFQQQPRIRSQSEDLYDSPDFEQQMKCNQTLEELNYFTSNLEFNEQLDDDKCTCRCSKCQGFITNMDGDVDADAKKRLKRREYKKRQKLKAQQKKQQALKELSVVIGDIYQLKTDFQTERAKIEEWLKAIQKNVNRFYQFINAVIRQQVESIKKQLRICLSQLATAQPNFSKVPRLYEQFMKVKDASPQVQKIINAFIDIISEKSQEPTKYQKDLDKKTFRFLLISDTQNRNAFLQVIKLIEQGNIKHQRQKQMLRMMIEMIKQKNISSECSSSDQGSEAQYSDNQDQYYDQTQVHGQNTTKASEQEEECSECFDEYDQNEKENTEMKNNSGGKGVKRRRKNKNLKLYEPSFEKTYETLVQLEKTLGYRKEERLPCNLEEEWLEEFRDKMAKRVKVKEIKIEKKVQQKIQKKK